MDKEEIKISFSRFSTDKLHWFRMIFKLYVKKNVKTLRHILLIILSLLPVFSVIFFEYFLTFRQPYTPRKLNVFLFWDSFIGGFNTFGVFIPILLSYNVISKDFHTRTALTLMTEIPRRKYIIWNILLTIGHLFLLILLPFLIFNLVIYIKTVSFVMPIIFIIGVLFIFIFSLGFLSFTFILTSLTQNSAISLIIPIIYFTFNYFFQIFEIPLLSLSYHFDQVFNYLRDVFLFTFHVPSASETIFPHLDLLIFIIRAADVPILTGGLIFSFLVIILFPIILFILSIHGFNLIDIRLD